MFADDTNLFLSKIYLKQLIINFSMLITGSEQTNFLFIQEKYYLSFLHKQRLCDSIPLRLDILKFNYVETKKKDRPQLNFLE